MALPAAPLFQKPTLPIQWHAIVLLNAFDDSPPVVAELWYDGTQVTPMMYAIVSDLYGNQIMLVIEAESYYVNLSGTWYGPLTNPDWHLPPQDYLSGYSDYGHQKLLSVESQWWARLYNSCTNGQMSDMGYKPYDGDVPVSVWINTRDDNGLPWRFQMLDQGNPVKWAVLGDFFTSNFATFEAVTETPLTTVLPALNAATKQPKLFTAALGAELIYSLLNKAKQQTPDAAQPARIQELIPGLQPLGDDCNGYTGMPPIWRTRFAVSVITTMTIGVVQSSPCVPHNPAEISETTVPVPCFTPYAAPGVVYYDWGQRRQLTRFFLPDGVIEDLLLTDHSTYLIIRTPGQNPTCVERFSTVGMPYPDWTQRDGYVCHAQIINNPVFGPNETILIISAPSSQNRFFWCWFTGEARPLLFAETPQCCNVPLATIDYLDYQPDAEIDPKIFDLPSECS